MARRRPLRAGRLLSRPSFSTFAASVNARDGRGPTPVNPSPSFSFLRKPYVLSLPRTL